MGECVKLVDGLPSNSSSPTDSWILTYNNNTRYDDISMPNGFIKWWIDPVTLKYQNNKIDDIYINTLEGLNYEVDVYKDVIRILIDYNICTNFVRFLGSSKRCTIDDLGKMLVNKTKNNKTDEFLSKPQIIQNLRRNVIYMVNHMTQRPSINEITEEKYPEDIIIPQDGWKYNFLVNKPTTNFTVTAESFLQQYAEFPKAVFQVVFQVIAACYVMYLSKMSHNDLHPGNIWVTPVIEKSVVYLYNNNTYGFKTTVHTEVYDFDRSYVEAFGNNKIITPHLHTYSQTNSIVDNRDMIKFLSYVYIYGTDRTKKIILDVIIQDTLKTQSKTVPYVIDILEDRFMRIGETAIPVEQYSQLFKTPEEILHGIGIQILEFDTLEGVRLIDKNNIFLCNKSIFNQNGRVIIDKKSDILICKSEVERLKEEYNKLKLSMTSK